MDQQWKVYRYTFPNGKVYIGCTGQPLKARCQPSNYHKGMPVHEAFAAFPRGSWKLDIISVWNTEQEGLSAEMREIEAHKSTNPEFGYNCTSGGKGSLGTKHTDEWKTANAKRMQGRKLSDSTKERMRKHFKGMPRLDLAGSANGFYGKRHDESTLKRISEIGRSKHFSDEIRKHMSEGHRGKQRATPVFCVETGKTYNTLKAAEADTGIDSSCISAVAHGRGYTAGGFHWKLAQIA